MVGFLIFKPIFVDKEKKETTTQTTRVEDLLTGEHNNFEEENKAEEITSNFKPFEDELNFEHHDFIPPERPNPEDYLQKQQNTFESEDLKLPENLKVENINNTTQPQQKMVDEKAYKEIENQINNNPNLKSVTNELKEKYNNNPNAEVSNDDINYFMLKMLESSQKQ